VRAFGAKAPIAVIPNGVQLPEAGGDHKLRLSWLPDDGRRTLLYVGRLHPKKGLMETLDGWSIVTDRCPELAARWRLVIAGWDDGNHAESLVTHARSLGLSDVMFPGPVFGEEKDSLYAHADAFILASYSEGSPMAVLEAWAHNLPVFMTRGCNLPEGFAEGAAIEITTDPQDIAKTLFSYLGTSDLAEIGKRGHALVQKRFSWPTIAKDLQAVYAWLAGRGQRPECVMFG
jgi:glycosyltransferase involved in cell wall biosynthesis